MSDLEPKCRPTRLILLFSFLICSSLCSAADEELQILLDLKSNLRSSNLTLFDSWTPDASPCSFSGISCLTPGAVTGIDLTGKGLSGILSIGSICRLPSLRKLALGANSLVGNLRGDFKNCGNLEYLDLAFNGLTGTVPDLSSLSKLQVLNLSDNGFTGPFPWSSLKNLTELGVLSLGDNPFDISSFPSEILNLKKIYWIYLTNCTLEGKIPVEIGDLPELVHLELSTNNFTGEIPAEITKLKKLTMLEIYENQLTGKLPVGFGNLSNLEFFDASANRLEGDLQELKFLTKIISLQLYDNQFSGEIPAEFGYFKGLVNLSLYSNKLSGSLPQTLGSWGKFDFIDVSDNGFTGPIPADMCKRGTMTRLLLLDNQFSGEIPASYGNCSSLVRFRVTNNKLSGKVPVKIWGLPNVVIIDLAGNNFEGPLTSDIQGAISLGTLSLAFNRFSGDFPTEISKATSLVSIDAQFNKFSGNIPSGIGKLKKLDSLYLQNNLLSGKIPGELGSCVSISQINLAGNSLSGQIPGSLGTLQSLNSLNLSDNDISGHIPASLSALKLSHFDLSNNRLSGQIPQALSIEAYAKSYDGNPGLCSLISTNFRPCPANSGNSSHFRTLISCFFIGTAILVASLGYLIFHRKRKSDHSRSFKDDSWNLKSFQILSFSEQEILNGIKQENLIGKGGSGNVYKVALPSGKDLAVKHIWNVGEDGRKSTSAMLTRQPGKLSEFDAEVAVLSSIRHVNVVKLYCSITSEDSSLLVYEYMPNGSLWDRMHTCQKMELDWGTRYDVAVGAAKGLEYLHHGCERPVIHRDVKSSNILLDEFFKPRIADFGLARIVPASAGKDSTHVIAGTHGYIAPEYAYTYKVNEKSDVYSFGVVLMELVTGKRPIEPEFGENKDIVGWISTKMTSRESVMGVVDPNIPKSLHEDVVKVLRIGVLCTAKLPSLRPTMRTVVQLLEDAEPCKFMSIIFKDGKEGETKEKTSPNH